MPHERTSRAIRASDLLAYAAPLLVILTLLTIYLVAPEFYLARVLELQHRESQAVEMATVACLAVALVPLAWAAGRLWRTLPPADHVPPGLPRLLHRYGAAAFVSLILLATVFFLGEEINWGQTIKLWLDPKHNLPVQTNVHNNIPGISVQGLGSLGLACAFFVAPLLWAFRRPLKLPATLAPAIAEGPVIACLAIATGWKWFKDVYVAVAGRSRDDGFYWDFVEQINEQKELLVALSLMLYALYRLAAARRATPAVPRSAPEPQDPHLVGAARD
jgi:Kef-type K+ transport system membrane component KefB